MNVLIVGLGSIAKKHIGFLKQIDPSIVFFSLFSRNRLEIEDIINIDNIEQLQNIRLDFIIISNPTSLHTKSIKELSKFRVPFFVEKPLTFSVRDTEQIVQFLKTENLSVFVGYSLRFHPLVTELKNRIVQLGKIEEVNLYNGSYLPSWRPGTEYKLSYSANPSLGGGVELDMSHEIDLVYWFFGSPKGIRSFRSCASSLGIESNDYANYLFSYEEFNASVILNYYRKWPKRTFEIISQSGVIEVDFLHSTLKYNEEVVLTEKNAFERMYFEQWIFFLNELRSNSRPFTNFANLLAISQMISS